MSILIGFGKSKNKEDGQTYISGYFSEEFLSLCPQFKDFRFVLNYIPEDKRRDKEKSPGWAVEIYKPKDNPSSDDSPIFK